MAKWTGQYQYTIDQILNELIERCRELRLRVRGSEARVFRECQLMLAVQTMNFLHHGLHKVAL